MKRCAVLALTLSGCFGPIIPAPYVPDPVGAAVIASNANAAPVAVAGTVSACTGDAQCLGPADVIVCDDEWFCAVGHTMTPPSPQTKNQGQFMRVRDGQAIWTSRWYMTRPLVQGEPVQLGQQILFFRGPAPYNAFTGPGSHQDALNGNWTATTVTDLSNLFKNIIVTSNGGSQVMTSDVRVVTGAGSPIQPN